MEEQSKEHQEEERGGQECPRSEGISAGTALHIMRLLEGDEMTEEKIMQFLKERYGATTVLEIPPRVASEIIRRPGDFVRAARRWCEPELAL